MLREKYFEELRSRSSPLTLLRGEVDLLLEIRSHHPQDHVETFLRFAQNLMTINDPAAKTRAEFIVRQCKGDISEAFYEAHCESWGIPIFKEGLLNASDFKNGFLFTFRDHSTSWSEDNEARSWFYCHLEAKFIKEYEFWACDNGPEEVILRESGSYKAILWELVRKYKDHYALVSPEFTRLDLKMYSETFNEEDEGLEREALMEIISKNPNW